jgi:hypothetical protein
MLVFPTHQYLVTVHDAIAGIRHGIDALKKSLDDREFFLKNTNQGAATTSPEYDMDDLVIEDLLDIDSVSRREGVFSQKSLEGAGCGTSLMMDISVDD